MARKLSRRVLAEYAGERLIAGDSPKKISQLLAAHLLQSKRVKELALIISDIEYYLADRGVVMATVTSAFDLTDATTLAIKKMISDQTGATSISLDQVIDHTVLGGIKLSLPGRELDTTIARKLATLRTNYKKA